MNKVPSAIFHFFLAVSFQFLSAVHDRSHNAFPHLQGRKVSRTWSVIFWQRRIRMMNFFLQMSSLFFWLESISFYTHMKMMRPSTGTDAPCSRRPSPSELLGGAVPWYVRVNSFTRTRLVQQCQRVHDVDQIRRHMPFFPAPKSLPTGDVVFGHCPPRHSTESLKTYTFDCELLHRGETLLNRYNIHVPRCTF